MTQSNTPPQKDPATSPEFRRFEELTRRVLRVTKKELDAKLAEEKRRKSTGRQS